MRAAQLVAGACVAGVAAVGFLWANPQVAPPSADAAPRVSGLITCQSYAGGIVRCVIPTGGRLARVTVRVYEDGSGSCVVHDPDATPWSGGKKARR